jgi:hypothetical protein
MDTKIEELARTVASLEATRAQIDAQGYSYLDAQIANAKRLLRWHVIRATQPHPNVGRASLCQAGRPKRPTYDEAPAATPAG